MGDVDWRERAACRGLPVSLFVPTQRESVSALPKAQAICRGCPVQDECLNYALGFPEEAHGVWGGTTRKDRATMRGVQWD